MFLNLIRRGGAGILSRQPAESSPTMSLICDSFRGFHISSALYAEPLKKKKRLDPQIMRMREQRKMKKLEKGIRLLKKHAKKFKPIDEMEVSPKLQKELSLRKRVNEAIPETVLSFRDDLIRVWSDIRSVQYRQEIKTIQAMIECQNAALEELRLTNSSLFDAAIQPDEKLLPTRFRALTETPPIKNYDVPDGKYSDISKKWRP